MQNRSSKKMPQDVNQLAKAIVLAATAEAPLPITEDGKNAAAVALGRLGGKKGGPARAAKLSKRRRAAIAKNAAEVRWKKHESAKSADIAGATGV
jgi:hypothetical protein